MQNNQVSTSIYYSQSIPKSSTTSQETFSHSLHPYKGDQMHHSRFVKPGHCCSLLIIKDTQSLPNYSLWAAQIVAVNQALEVDQYPLSKPDLFTSLVGIKKFMNCHKPTSSYYCVKILQLYAQGTLPVYYAASLYCLCTSNDHGYYLQGVPNDM